MRRILRLYADDKEKMAYCQDCLNVKIVSPLRNRIYLDDKGKITTPGPDAEVAAMLDMWPYGRSL